jgi:UDP-N-acetylmuramoylalanine--D-glutamate ligase
MGTAGAPAGPVRLRKLMPVDALRISGAHNHQNAMAALALALAVGGSLAPMLRALREYRGEPHRCQLLLRIDEVDYFDDSKGTNVGASVAALEGLGRPAVLIAGGEGKGQDFNPLADAVARHARAVVLIGRDARLIGDALAHTGPPIEYCESLDEAVSRARAIARPGDAVLLSPACASFDMFRSYVHRGQVFASIVQRLADEAGLPVELAC